MAPTSFVLPDPPKHLPQPPLYRLFVRLLPSPSSQAVSLRMGISCAGEGDSTATVSRVARPGAHTLPRPLAGHFNNAGLTAPRRPHLGGAQSLRRDLHGADVVLCVFDGRPASAAHEPVFLEHCRVGSGQRVHHVGFSDHVELSWAAIAIIEHASYYGDNGAISIKTSQAAGTWDFCVCGASRRCRAGRRCSCR